MSEHLKRIIAEAMSNSVWIPASITDEPETRLTQWRIFRVSGDFDQTGDTIHFVGYAGYEGRVCSPVQKFDSSTKKGITRSGRIYELVGNSGHNNDAMHVWNTWLKMHGNPPIEDLTDIYSGE
jgi:hypothetical protein